MNISSNRFKSLQVSLAVWTPHAAVKGNHQRSFLQQLDRGDQYATRVCQRERRRMIAGFERIRFILRRHAISLRYATTIDAGRSECVAAQLARRLSTRPL